PFWSAAIHRRFLFCFSDAWHPNRKAKESGDESPHSKGSETAKAKESGDESPHSKKSTYPSGYSGRRMCRYANRTGLTAVSPGVSTSMIVPATAAYAAL